MASSASVPHTRILAGLVLGAVAEGKLSDAKKKECGVQTFVNVVPANPFKAFVDKDMLAIIFTGLLVGFALTRIETHFAKTLIEVLEGINRVAEVVIRWAMAI